MCFCPNTLQHLHGLCTGKDVGEIGLRSVVRNCPAFCFCMNIRKPLPPKKTITYRNLRNINIVDFAGDLRLRLDGHIVSADDLDAAVCHLDTALSETLDHHVPKKQRTVRIRPIAPRSSMRGKLNVVLSVNIENPNLK